MKIRVSSVKSRITLLAMVFNFLFAFYPHSVNAQTPFNFQFKDTKISVDQNGCMRVEVENFVMIDSFKFGFTYDTSKFKFTEAFSIALDEEMEYLESQDMEEGLVSISYFTIEESLDDGQTAFILCFDAVGDFDEVSAIEITELENGDTPMIFSHGLGYGIPDFNIQTADLIIDEFIPPTFSESLFFEDANGRLDTLTIGYDLRGTIGIDTGFEEHNILDNPLDEFDVRFFAYENYLEEELSFDCDHEDFDFPDYLEDIATHESKTSITQSGCSIGGSIFTFSLFTIPSDSDFPITIKWDKQAFMEDNNCGATISWISELSREEYIREDWCQERINYDSISLSGLDSIVIESPSFKTIARRDSTLFSVYYIYLTDVGDIGQVSVNKLLESNLNIFPNPVQDRIYLESIDQDFLYQIYNLQGQQIQQGVYRENIDVARLSSGIYFLQLSEKDGLYQAIKFVKK